MGLLDKLIRKSEKKCINTEPGKIYAPVTGKYIPLEKIPDTVFSAGILGRGCGIEPYEGKVVAPMDGKISAVAETKHAIGIMTEEGVELLIHVGLDTVDMNGKGFIVQVNQGDTISCGQTLMIFSKEEIEAANHPSTIAFVITNSDEFSMINFKVDEEH